MASAVMRRVLEWVIVACEARAGASRIVLATLPEEYHEIGALLAATTAAAAGWSVTYLGANLPVAGIAAAAEQVNAAAVGVSVVYALDARRVRAQVDELRALLPARIDLLVGGSAWLRLGRKRGVTGVHTVRDLADLRAYLGRPTGVDASRSRRAR
jgi:methylmalonyl-CoA mutase cobalamin-binding subunit